MTHRSLPLTRRLIEENTHLIKRYHYKHPKYPPSLMIKLSVLFSTMGGVLSFSTAQQCSHFHRSSFSKPTRISHSSLTLSGVQSYSTHPLKSRLNHSISQQSPVIPRAAVSVIVRLEIPNKVRSSHDQNQVLYALVQRGKEPNKGIWSFPGGKIETGETSLDAAKRELWEETSLSEDAPPATRCWKLKFFEDGPVTSTDSIIHRHDSVVAFHYVIAQWFAHIIFDLELVESSDPTKVLPNLMASDDAAGAKWWSEEDILIGVSSGLITKGVERVIHRSERLYQKGLL